MTVAGIRQCDSDSLLIDPISCKIRRQARISLPCVNKPDPPEGCPNAHGAAAAEAFGSGGDGSHQVATLSPRPHGPAAPVNAGRTSGPPGHPGYPTAAPSGTGRDAGPEARRPANSNFAKNRRIFTVPHSRSARQGSDGVLDARFKAVARPHRPRLRPIAPGTTARQAVQDSDYAAISSRSTLRQQALGDGDRRGKIGAPCLNTPGGLTFNRCRSTDPAWRAPESVVSPYRH